MNNLFKKGVSVLLSAGVIATSLTMPAALSVLADTTAKYSGILTPDTTVYQKASGNVTLKKSITPVNDGDEFRVKLEVSGTPYYTTTNEAVDVVLLLDTSGSMYGRMGALKDAANNAVDSLKANPNAKVSIVSFDKLANTSGLDTSLHALSNDSGVNSVKSIISSLTTHNDGTFIQAGLKSAETVLAGDSKVTDDHKYIVLMSDGEPNLSYKASNDSSQSGADSVKPYTADTTHNYRITSFNYGKVISSIYPGGGGTVGFYSFQSRRNGDNPYTLSDGHTSYTVSDHGIGTISEADIAKQKYTIYSIGAYLDTNDTVANYVLNNCASPNCYTTASTADELKKVFTAIANKVTTTYSNITVNDTVDGQYTYEGPSSSTSGAATPTMGTVTYGSSNSPSWDASTKQIKWLITPSSASLGTQTFEYLIKINHTGLTSKDYPVGTSTTVTDGHSTSQPVNQPKVTVGKVNVILNYSRVHVSGSTVTPIDANGSAVASSSTTPGVGDCIASGTVKDGSSANDKNYDIGGNCNISSIGNGTPSLPVGHSYELYSGFPISRTFSIDDVTSGSNDVNVFVQYKEKSSITVHYSFSGGTRTQGDASIQAYVGDSLKDYQSDDKIDNVSFSDYTTGTPYVGSNPASTLSGSNELVKESGTSAITVPYTLKTGNISIVYYRVNAAGRAIGPDGNLIDTNTAHTSDNDAVKANSAARLGNYNGSIAQNYHSQFTLNAANLTSNYGSKASGLTPAYAGSYSESFTPEPGTADKTFYVPYKQSVTVPVTYSANRGTLNPGSNNIAAYVGDSYASLDNQANQGILHRTYTSYGTGTIHYPDPALVSTNPATITVNYIRDVKIHYVVEKVDGSQDGADLYSQTLAATEGSTSQSVPSAAGHIPSGYTQDTARPVYSSVDLATVGTDDLYVYYTIDYTVHYTVNNNDRGSFSEGSVKSGTVISSVQGLIPAPAYYDLTVTPSTIDRNHTVVNAAYTQQTGTVDIVYYLVNRDGKAIGTDGVVIGNGVSNDAKNAAHIGNAVPYAQVGSSVYTPVAAGSQLSLSNTTRSDLIKMSLTGGYSLYGNSADTFASELVTNGGIAKLYVPYKLPVQVPVSYSADHGTLTPSSDTVNGFAGDNYTDYGSDPAVTKTFADYGPGSVTYPSGTVGTAPATIVVSYQHDTGSVEIVRYLVNRDGKPITASGTVVGSAADAKHIGDSAPYSSSVYTGTQVTLTGGDSSYILPTIDGGYSLYSQASYTSKPVTKGATAELYVPYTQSVNVTIQYVDDNSKVLDNNSGDTAFMVGDTFPTVNTSAYQLYNNKSYKLLSVDPAVIPSLVTVGTDVTVHLSDIYPYTITYHFGDTVKTVPGKAEYGMSIPYTTDPSVADSTKVGYIFDHAAVPHDTIIDDSDHVENVADVYFNNQYGFSATYTENGKSFGKAPFTSGKLAYGTAVTANDLPGVLTGLPDGFKLNSITVDGVKIDNPAQASTVLFSIAASTDKSVKNVVVVDYTEDSFGYTVNYIDTATGKTIASDNSGKAVFDSTVTLKPIDITGYTPVSTASKDLKIQSDVSKNVVNFYYAKAATIDDNTTPQSGTPTTPSTPSTPTATIPDNSTPLASNPNTGDNGSTLPFLAAILGLVSASVVKFIRRKKKA